MKKTWILVMVLCGVSSAGLLNVIGSSLVIAGEKEVVVHTEVSEPTKALMNDIARRIDNILGGILAGNFKYVAQEAGAIVDKSYKINDTFFRKDPKENEWFKRVRIDPGDDETITKIKEKFDVYLKRIVESALEVQKVSRTNDQEATLKSFVTMIERSCFECHKEIRDKQVPIENR